MKLIGISSSISNTQTYLNTAYYEAFVRPGVSPVGLPILPLANREVITQDEFNDLHKDTVAAYVDKLDGLVLSGGQDVNPLVFDDEVWGASGFNSQRDMTELALMRGFIEAGKPVLGICRGHQIASLALGLTNFLQDIEGVGENHNNAARETKDRQEPAHSVRLFGAFRDYLREKTGRADMDKMTVNSFHHEAFCLTPTGKLSKEDSKNLGVWYPKTLKAYEIENDINILAATLMVIEAIERPAARFVGMQWHGEEFGPGGLAIQYWIDKYLNA